MKQYNLILITNHFPFGQGESFLEHEIPFLSSSFDKVVILSKNVSSKESRKIAPNVFVERVNPKSSLIENLSTAFRIGQRIPLFATLLIQEFSYLKRREKSGSILSAFHFLFKAYQLKIKIEHIIKRHHISENLCLYSYWMNSSALAVSLVEANGIVLKKITRAHGGDLFEYRQENNYLSFRELLVQMLDRVVPISTHGSDYLKTLVDKKYHHKIKESHLGTPQPKTVPVKNDKTTSFKIVSCSNLIPLKRIHLIIESLALLEAGTFNWIHFGDGPLKDDFAALASKLLGTKSNITFEFKGFVPNSELIEYYSSHYIDLFINTSLYEGVPVSMMEALSFGIPIIGTDVGSVREIITEKTGFLLNESATPQEISSCIQNLTQKSDNEISILRNNCQGHWGAHYNAEYNFSTFATELKNLFNEI